MSDVWNRFIETDQGGYLKEFLDILRKEIVDNNASGLKERESVLLLNTRKGYWIYKIYENEVAGSKVKVYSDRYVQKNSDFSVFSGKIIYLVDDTLLHGYSLLETYELLAENVDESLIFPVVFTAIDEIDIEQKRKSTTGIGRNFWNKLKSYLLMSEDEISELCILETQLIHSEGIPNMIDLPFLKDSCRKTKELDFQFFLKKEQFKALQRNRKEWSFNFNTHAIENNNVLQGFIMQLKNEQLLKCTKEFVHDLVMEGTYILNEDGSAWVVFTPFAILKSMNKSFLKKLWSIIFDTQESNCNPTEDEDNKSCWIRFHRECVYALSMMITEYFRKEIADEIGIKLEYDYNILKDHFPENMIKRMQNLEKAVKKENSMFFERLEKIYGQKNDYVCSVEETDIRKKRKYNEERAYKEIWQMIKKKKDEFINLQGSERTIEQKLASVMEIGQMERLLDDCFDFGSNEEKRYALTRVIVTILRSSVCSNKLEISLDGKCLVRGFRYGENSDLLLPFFDLFFYWAVILLVSKREIDGAARCYEGFINKLRRRYEKLNLLSDNFAIDDFRLNCDYYKSALENRQYVYNKFWLIQPYLRNQMIESKAYYMREMEEFVAAEC